MTIDAVGAVAAFVAAWNRRDRSAIAAALHANVVCHGIPMAPARGREAAMALLDGFLAADEIDWRILHIAASGPMVLTERIDRFRFGDHGWTAVRAAGVFELDPDGRVVAWRDYFDMAELEAALPQTRGAEA